ncbi:UNKNOWN [Stylonychia lemnae]|uniref:Transmembrane protein n=1 Tax=Stylonychia lemnae TaxID=5949 RepID=A0A078B2G7_STYLE|nr:UNKNOWN [Stylonychia lemnae]|eukprot:CDW88426.1 UNKNOWN [Stylonychia lemnae]
MQQLKDDDTPLSKVFFILLLVLTGVVMLSGIINIAILMRNQKRWNIDILFFYIFSLATLTLMCLFFLDSAFDWGDCVYMIFMSSITYTYICSVICYLTHIAATKMLSITFKVMEVIKTMAAYNLWDTIIRTSVAFIMREIGKIHKLNQILFRAFSIQVKEELFIKEVLIKYYDYYLETQSNKYQSKVQIYTDKDVYTETMNQDIYTNHQYQIENTHFNYNSSPSQNFMIDSPAQSDYQALLSKNNFKSSIMKQEIQDYMNYDQYSDQIDKSAHSYSHINHHHQNHLDHKELKEQLKRHAECINSQGKSL